MAYLFRNKVVWITGSSSGIGLALTRKLIKVGAKVAVTSRNQKKLESLFSQEESIHIFPGDLTSESKNIEIANHIVKKFGRLDCVILNAGNAEYVDINNFSSDVFERMIQVNYLSVVKGIVATLPHLRQSESPYLVGMSSSAAYYGLPQGQAYSASKAAIRNLFQGLRIELAVENIDVSWICPGFVETPLTDKNDFPMPIRITAEEAAETIVKKLSQKKAEIHFPKRFTLFFKLIAMLPANWSSKILKNTVPEKNTQKSKCKGEVVND